MEKQKVVYPYNGIPVKKRNDVAIHATTQMSLKKIKLKKPDTKHHILYDI